MAIKKKKARAAILTSDKMDFEQNDKKSDKEGHCIMIKVSIHQFIISVNIYKLNIRAPKYIEQILTELTGGINNNTIAFGEFNNTLLPIDRSSREPMKNKANLNTIKWVKLTVIYRKFYPIAEYTFFSSPHG